MALDPGKDKPVEAPPPKSKKKLMIIIVAVVVLVGGGVGSYFIFAHKPAKHEAEKVEEKHVAKPVFVPLEAFTVNLLSDPDEQFLQVEMTLKATDEPEAESIKEHMPQVRDRILMLLTSKHGSEITTPEGKRLLSSEIIKQMNTPFSKGEKPQAITGVFFTSFVIQ